ncbi:MAG: bifunctional riboflavin kinase/FAD synthetase [Candidatus Dormibacteraeota bacterium]|uniref:Riboflavin biosynthesis protein n=1 Tax=Candidatus Amunia macphersoniae TaxID=3127014 RepID=A0A934NGL4_9BACT|nr:bifunctional riboflavin kinase/FAD synthetase [Candidatus Dormibacteraeota bacterium]
MRVDSGLGRRQDGDAPVVLTIGNFDGVHRGHQALLDEVRVTAASMDAQTALLTFNPHPRCVLDPARCPQSLTTVAEKRDLLAHGGLDRLVVLGFTREVSSWGAEQFCDLLGDAFDLRALVVGHDFALGHKRQGDIAFLRDYGARHGIAVMQVGEVRAEAGAVSSSRIRELVSAGDVTGAMLLLGRPYFMDARVEHGKEVGRHLGYPTANLSIATEKCLPQAGVYAMWVRVGGRWHMAATNVGYRPTFGGDRLTVEAYLLDFSGDLYDHDVRAVFVERLREERAYASVDELVAQIGRDVDQARRLLTGVAPPSL